MSASIAAISMSGVRICLLIDQAGIIIEGLLLGWREYSLIVSL